MKVVVSAILGLGLLATAPISFAKQHASNYQTDISRNIAVRHEIFQSMYVSNNQNTKQSKTSRIKAFIQKVKQSVDIGFDENIHLKVSSVKSGPLKQSITQMVELAPGLQTHDGFVGDSSKGYGIKFTYKFD